MAKKKQAAEVQPEAPLTISEYVSKALDKFITARNEYMQENDAEVRFLVASEEAKIAIAQSTMLLLSDLQTRISAVLDKADKTLEK